MPDVPAAARTPLLSVVVPVYNESAVLPAFIERATRAFSAIPDMGYEIVFVDDGCRDDSFAKLSAAAAKDPRIRIVKFSRNFGHQIAITAGVDHARGDCVVVIDADLQDPPEVVGAMVDQWRAGFDVIYGVRQTREGESTMKLATAAVFYRLLSRLTNIQIPNDVGDFRLMSRRAVDELSKLREKDRFVRGLVSWIGFRQTGVVYNRDKREAGETKYPYRKMIKFALDGITSFSTVPLRIATWMGYISAMLAVLYLIYVLIMRFLGFTIEGWATIMVAMLFLGSVQLICLGILGEYLGRVFNEVKPRPMYVVEEFVAAPEAGRTPVEHAAAAVR